MGSIQTITSSSLSLSTEQSFDSKRKPHHSKTLDIGLEGNTVSANPLGDVCPHLLCSNILFEFIDKVLIKQKILQLSCYHPLHGIVVACPFAQFDGDRFYDSEYVREYRKRLLDYVHSGRRGFGVHLKGTVSDLKSTSGANNIKVTYSLGKLQVKTTISVSKEQGVVQSTDLISTSTQKLDFDYALALNVGVNRASYGQLTEGGPIPIPQPRNEFQLLESSRAWAVSNPNLDAIIQGALYCDGHRVCLEPMDGNTTHIEQPISKAFHGTLEIYPDQTRNLTSTYRLLPGTEISGSSHLPLKVSLRSEDVWKIRNENMSLIIKGNVSYILGNCTIPVSNMATCLITDHVALPLGWNRDN